MTHVIPLTRANLPQISAGVKKPGFPLTDVCPGIVHLGLGGFHRAHMARYTHDLMDVRSDALDWGIIGVGLLPSDIRMRDALVPQDGLYTLVERQGDIESATVIGSLSDVVFAGNSSRLVLDAIANPAIRIVSLTVTENGYCLNPATKLLNFQHPSIAHDVINPTNPRSAIGILVEAYRRRRADKLPAMTALTCDNMQHNGRVLRGAVLALAERVEPALAIWIEAHSSFPSSMVDRITPATTPEDLRYLASRYCVGDQWPVFSEVFRQWVIEEHFVQGRPGWEGVGAQFVRDVAPYEFMKLRLLNASHLAVAGLGRLAGYRYIDEALNDDSLRAYMQALMDRETGPTVPPVPGVDLVKYKSQLLQRFANSKINDTVDRVIADAPINLLIDPIRDRLESGGDFRLLALALAAWMRRVRGEDESGRPLKVIHPLAILLRDRALEGGMNPRPLLAVTNLFGELVDHGGFVKILETWLTKLYSVGAKATLAEARTELNF